MIVTDFISQKKRKKSHSKSEIHDFIQLYAHDQIPDYQVAAWLMAAFLNGMTDEETQALTEAMVHSGELLTWDSSSFLPCDKHSTGGVGDKTSLIIAPLVASFGVPVPMVAGRGLGFTGGTLDKLESIPGFQTRISIQQMKQQMSELGFFLAGQTEQLCPADKRMYALRDVTETVDSLPLICASILSKKIAEGAKALVMDVKWGSGAFMSSKEEATNLARALIRVGQLGGLEVKALLTDMNEPLGRYVGNALEVQECLQILKDQNPNDEFKDFRETRELSLELAAHMLNLSGYNSDLTKCRQDCESHLQSGKALEYFERLVRAQGGNLSLFKLKTDGVAEILASETGYLCYTSNQKVGMASLLLGGGRQKHSDQIDPQVGIEVLFRHGDLVRQGDTLFKIHYSRNNRLAAASQALNESFQILEAAPLTRNLIEELR